MHEPSGISIVLDRDLDASDFLMPNDFFSQFFFWYILCVLFRPFFVYKVCLCLRVHSRLEFKVGHMMKKKNTPLDLFINKSVMSKKFGTFSENILLQTHQKKG